MAVSRKRQAQLPLPTSAPGRQRTVRPDTVISGGEDREDRHFGVPNTRRYGTRVATTLRSWTHGTRADPGNREILVGMAAHITARTPAPDRGYIVECHECGWTARADSPEEADQLGDDHVISESD